MCIIASGRMAGVWRCMLAVVVLMCVCLWGSTEAVGGAKSRPRPQKRPPKKPKVDPIDLTPAAQNIDIQQVKKTGARGTVQYTVYTTICVCYFYVCALSAVF